MVIIERYYRAFSVKPERASFFVLTGEGKAGKILVS